MSSSSRLKKKTFGELSPAQRMLVIVLGVVQLALSAAAWVDLALRPADKVNGNKLRWAFVIAVNFFGPIRYFRKGRRD